MLRQRANSYPTENLRKFASFVGDLEWTGVKNLLQCGMDARQIVNDPWDNNPSYTLIHIVFKTKSIFISAHELKKLAKIIKLLVLYGADINAKDAYGNSCVHFVAREPVYRLKIIRMLIGFRADLDCENSNRETPLQILLDHAPKIDEIKFFIDKGFSLNDSNPITRKGYLAEAVKWCERHIFGIVKNLDVVSLDELGRNCIQNCIYKPSPQYRSVFDVYTPLIGHLMRAGCDIHHLDYSGMSALDVAIEFGNKNALVSLLECGFEIDPNYYQKVADLVDSKDLIRLIKFDYYMHVLGLYTKEKPLHEIYRYDEETPSFEIDLKRYEEIKVGPYKLIDFLSDTNGAIIYQKCNIEERAEVDKFFQKYIFLDDYSRNERFAEQVLHGKDRAIEKTMFMIQYAKIKCRRYTINRASDTFDSLINFAIPDLCKHMILKLLPYSDLKNLIVAATKRTK